MKHLRCIGGPAHGRVIQMTDRDRDVRLVDIRPMPSAPVGPAALDVAAATATRLHYTQRTIATAEGQVNYLVLAAMTDLQALRIALGPIGIDRSKQLEDLKRAAEAFRIAMIESGAILHVRPALYTEQLNKLECALNSQNYRLDDAS